MPGGSQAVSTVTDSRQQRLANEGIFDYESLRGLASQQRDYRIDRLVPIRSIGVRVGDSGLGKTALSMMEGLAVASGRPFLGHGVAQGRVLYCDAESGAHECVKMIERLASFLQLDQPPTDFHVWSPNFDPRPHDPSKFLSAVLAEQVELLRPVHVIVDPLRAFWPVAEESAKEAMEMVRELRRLSKEFGCSWTLNHHRRKRNRQFPVTLEGDRHEFFEEAAGAMALINASDTRLGLEKPSGANKADLVLAGFLRGMGWSESIYLQRVFDDDGEPIGYAPLGGLSQLSANFQQAFSQLSPQFRFKDASTAVGGSSGSNTTAFLRQCLTAGILRKDGKLYIKVE
jgi:hypothetical protein